MHMKRIPQQISMALLTLGASATLMMTSAHAVSMSQPSYTHVNGAYLNSNSMKRGLFLDIEYELDHKVFLFAK